MEKEKSAVKPKPDISGQGEMALGVYRCPICGAEVDPHQDRCECGADLDWGRSK
jgi:hypothetical protein